MKAPSVYTKEIDLSVRVPSDGGVIGAIVLPAVKGPVNEPLFVTSEADFLKKFAPNERVEVGYHNGYFSALNFLSKASGLWVVRAARNATYAGLFLKAQGSDGHAYTPQKGVTDPTAVIFDEQPDLVGRPEIFNVVFAANANRGLAGKYFIFSSPANNYVVWYEVEFDARAEKTSINVLANGSGAIGDFVLLSTPTKNYAFYFVQNANSQPPSAIPADAEKVAVVVESPTATPAAVAELLLTALNASGAFTATRNGSTLSVTCKTAGAVKTQSASSNPQKFSVTVTEAGENAGLAGSQPALPTSATFIRVRIRDNVTAAAVTSATFNTLKTVNTDYDVEQADTNKLNFICKLRGKVTKASAETSGFVINVAQEGQSDTDAIDDALFIFSANQGAWGNDIYVKIITGPAVKEANAFNVEVYRKSNLNTPVEVFTCSRVEGHRDGYGRNIFVEEVLKASAYIRAISNRKVPSTVLPKATATPIALAGGSDGEAVTTSDWLKALSKLESKETYAFNVILDAGYAVPAWQQALASLAERRDDCVALLSMPIEAEMQPDYVEAMRKYVMEQLNINSSYCALYGPSVKIYDKFNDRVIAISPESFAALAISESANNYEIWYPPAGFKRGAIKVLDLTRRFSQAEIGALYDVGINCLRFAMGKGVVVWGQKTLLKRPSSLDRLNVRLLLNTIKPALASLLEDFIFDLNDTSTQTVITSLINGYMTNIQARRGVYEYKVVCDSTNNTPQDIANNKLNVHLYIKPTVAAEEITLATIITPYGLSFEEIAL